MQIFCRNTKYFVFLSFFAFACNLFFYVRWYSNCENNCNGFTSSEDENAHNFRNVLDSDARSLRALNGSSPPLFTIVTFLREGLDNEHLQIFVRSLIAQKSVTFNVIFLDEYSSCRKVEDNTNAFVDRLLRRDKELVEGLNYNIISKGGECRATTAESLNVMKSVRGSIHKETKWILSLKPTFQFDFQDNFLFQMIDFPIRQGASREEILRDNNFLHMNVAGMGCKIMSHNGGTLLEAGGILWNDGSLQRFGKGEKFADDDIYTYRRPVDFSSSDCLLLEKDLYMKFAPSENVFSENDYNYRLIEAQLMAQHMEKRYIWYEARSVVRDLDVSEVKQVSYQLSDETMVHLKPILDMEHLPPPEPTNTNEHITRASDLRARSSSSANIFYMDGELPFRGLGGGYGRSFDNLSMLSSMGHYVTVAAVDLYQECTEACQDALYELNIAVVRKKSYHMYLGYRIHLFDIVMVSRPTTLIRSIRWLKARYKLNAFALIYDCEALWFRRDVLLREASKAMNIDFPGKPYIFSDELQDFQHYANQQTELSMLHMPDIILAVSEGEKYFVSDYLNSQSKPSLREKSVYSIGHIVEQSLVSFDSLPKFEERSGLLFIAAFHSSMYYNGDAIWYFLKEVYPLIVKENNDIVLTIAGRGIPEELKSFVEKHEDLDDRHVSFVESPESLDDLYNSAKLFIVPHLYGAGIQFKVSETFGRGVPMVMSKLSASGFGIYSSSNKDKDAVACVGDSSGEIKNCIIELYTNKRKWESVQQSAIEFLHRTHNRQTISNKLSQIINEGLRIASNNKEKRTKSHEMYKFKIPSPKGKCNEGEVLYLAKYPDVVGGIEAGYFTSAYDHWKKDGAAEHREYICKDMFPTKNK